MRIHSIGAARISLTRRVKKHDMTSVLDQLQTHSGCVRSFCTYHRPRRWATSVIHTRQQRLRWLAAITSSGCFFTISTPPPKLYAPHGAAQAVHHQLTLVPFAENAICTIVVWPSYHATKNSGRDYWEVTESGKLASPLYTQPDAQISAVYVVTLH